MSGPAQAPAPTTPEQLADVAERILATAPRAADGFQAIEDLQRRAVRDLVRLAYESGRAEAGADSIVAALAPSMEPSAGDVGQRAVEAAVAVRRALEAQGKMAAAGEVERAVDAVRAAVGLAGD